MNLKGLRFWVMTLVEYDEFGKPTIVKSFNKPAKESSVKQGSYPTKAKTTVAKAPEVFKRFEITNADEVECDDIL